VNNRITYLFLWYFSCKFQKWSLTGKTMRELTDQQRLFLIESEQILTAWREARRQKQAHQYGMKWVRAADHASIRLYKSCQMLAQSPPTNLRLELQPAWAQDQHESALKMH